MNNETDMLEIQLRKCGIENSTEVVDSANCELGNETGSSNEVILKQFIKISTMLSWPEAKANCEAMGGRLYDNINFVTNGESDELHSMFQSNSGSIWFGLWSPANSDKWETTTGEIISESDISTWYPGNPSTTAEESRCVRILRKNSLDDVGCSSEFKSVCTIVD